MAGCNSLQVICHEKNSCEMGFELIPDVIDPVKGGVWKKIGDLVESNPTVHPRDSVAKVKNQMNDTAPISAVSVLVDGRPVGLVMSIHLDRILSSRYGHALFWDASIHEVMDSLPLIVESGQNMGEVAVLAMQREKSKVFDHILVTEEGTYLGIVPVQKLLTCLAAEHRNNGVELDRINGQLAEEIRNKKQAEEKLKTLNRDLESRVAERTRELENSNNQLKAAKEAAEASNRAKSDFLANMSHELRTPLNHIIGFTELVLEEHFGPLNEMQSEYLQDVMGSSKHLLSLINDILDLSKVEAGKYELEISGVNLHEVFENSLTMVKEKALKHQLELSADIKGLPEFMGCDERKLKQVLYNLLSNAVKFTPDGGRINLWAYVVKEKMTVASKVGSEVEEQFFDEALVVKIRDTGIGLKKEDVERIFYPFEQGDNSRQRKYQGTGLGLSLSKKLVELHGGSIWAESDGEGKGAQFSFILPFRSCSEMTDDSQHFSAVFL